MRRIAKMAGGVLLVLVVLAGALAAWGWHELRANGVRIRAEYAAGLSRVRLAFLEDQDLARTHLVLAPQGRSNDAGPGLNPRIGWDGDSQRVAKWRERLAQRPHLLVLEQSLVARIPKAWWATPPEVWRDLDFTWMAALAPYDHWDVETNSPWADTPTVAWPNGFPLLHEVIPWVKLRLAKGLAKGQLDEAVTEVEHLAALLLSTETLIGSAQGLQVLVLVDEALASLERQGLKAPVSENRMDSGTRSRALRATMAARVYLLAEAPEPYRGEADRIVVGRCAALNEALNPAMVLWDLEGREREHTFHWLELDGPVAATCRLSRIRRALATGPSTREANSGWYCEEAPQWLRGPCRALGIIPFAKSLDRALAIEIMTQMMLANASPVAWYEGRRAPEGHPSEADK